MLHFTFYLYFFMTLAIFVKNYFLPTSLFFLIPISDFRSTLFEIIILIFGVITLFIFFYMWWNANRFFPIHFRNIIIASHVIFLPSMILKGLNNEGSFVQWIELSIDLIAEPYRLLAFSYQASDVFGVTIQTGLFIIGVIVRSYEEKRMVVELVQRTQILER